MPKNSYLYTTIIFPFDLDVSIGYVQYKKEMRKWNDWFIKADKQLYDEKKKLKGR